MKDSKLERQANESISDLIATIEKLEDDNERLEKEVGELNRLLDAHESEIEELCGRIEILENGPLEFNSNIKIVKREEPPNYETY